MQPPSIPVPLKINGKTATDIKNSGYAKNSDGKWSWNFGGGSGGGGGGSASQGPPSLSRARSMASLDIFRGNAAPSVTHIAKELKVAHSATSRNIVGTEFKDAGQSELEIWRMENMTARPVSKEQYGKFFMGDAYIVLSAPGGRTSSYHIHFWIGKKSSQDKYGTAAYKTVELDNKFTGSAIHHREEQGKESTLFKTYFPNGIEYVEGGSASSFRHVKREVFPKRLLHLKGRRSVKAKQVEATYKSLNLGDVFVLDVGRTIFQWNGPQASRTERVKGVELIRNIKDNERGGRATIIVVEYNEDDKQNKKLDQFWEALGDKGTVAPADAGGDDDQAEKELDAEIILTKVYEERDQVKTEMVTTRPLKKEILDPHHAYVLDAKTEVFVWLGKSCLANQKTFANDYAKKVHSETVSWAPLVKIVQGAETPLFKEKFDNWKHLFPKTLDYGVSAQLLPSTTKREFCKEDIDFEALITAKPKPRPENSLSHDGTGVLKIWKIEDFKKVEIPETQHGIFFSSSCYIILYMEVKDGRRNHYIYFWQGRHASKENKGTSALLAKEMADAIRGKTQQFRVVHNREPEHFIMLFKGKMIVGMGEHPKSREDLSGLYHIKHHPNAHEWNVKAAQVPMTSEVLNSNDSFVVLTADHKCFVWNGAGSSSLERKIAKLVAARLVGDANVGKIITVDENKEVSFFWPHFPGGKKEYANAEYLKWNSKSPRLFLCSNTTGTFKVEEIYNFTQEDLDIYDPFILDCYAEVYVWVGSRSNEQEKKFAMQTALEYVAKASNIDGRDASTPIYYIIPGEEPIQFKCHFLAWDNNLVGDSRKIEDDDDGYRTPMKSSVIFKPAIVTSSDSSSRLHSLKSSPAPDPNRPKLVFSHPVPAASSPAQTEEKDKKDTRPPISFSFPKPATDQSGSSTGPTTPRSFTYTTAPTTPRSSGSNAPSSASSDPAAVTPSQIPVEQKPTKPVSDDRGDEAITDTTTPEPSASSSTPSEPSTTSTPSSDPSSLSSAPSSEPSSETSSEPSSTSSSAPSSVPSVPSEVKTKPTFSINLSPLASGSSASNIISSPVPSSTASTGEPTTPGRSSHVRPAYIKTKSDKIVANLTSASSTTTPSPRPVIYTTLISPRSSTPTSTIITLTPLSSVTTPASSSASSSSSSPSSSSSTSTAATAPTESLKTSQQTQKSSPSVSPSSSPKLIYISKTHPIAASSPSLLSLSSSPTPITSTIPSNSTGSLKTSQEEKKIIVTPKVSLVHVELAKYNREFYSLEELTARKKPPGVDVTCLEKYLVDEEFEKVFGMTKEKFYAIPVWKRVTIRKEKNLY